MYKLEDFKPVPQYEKFYEVNKFGTIRALDRLIDNYGQTIKLKQNNPKVKLVGGQCYAMLQDEKFKYRKVNITKVIKNLFGRQKPIKEKPKRKYKPRVSFGPKPINFAGAAGYSVEQVDDEEKVIKVFESFAAAAKAVGGQYRYISDCCYGRMKYYYGYKWRFANNNNLKN